MRRMSCSHGRSEEHTSELQSRLHLVCRLLLEKNYRRKICPRRGGLTHARYAPERLAAAMPRRVGVVAALVAHPRLSVLGALACFHSPAAAPPALSPPPPRRPRRP